MNYVVTKDEFDSIILNAMKAIYEANGIASIEANEGIKNNNVLKKGVLVKRPNSIISPIIYSDSYYVDYKNGRTIPSILSEILYVLENEQQPNIDIDCIKNFERIKDKIVCRLINYKLNEEMLKGIPHKKFLDMAIEFRIVVDDRKDSYGFVQVTETFMNMWNITTEELYEIAMENTKEIFKPDLFSMKDFLYSNIGKCHVPEDVHMWILSNKQKINGATSLLNKEFMEYVASVVGDTFYVLPSSVHECMIVGDLGIWDTKHLEEMVADANNTQVKDNEVLSYSVYIYNKDTGLSILD